MQPVPLDAIRAFAAELMKAPWFAACGAPLGAADRALAQAYAAALEMPDLRLATAATWPEAAGIAQRPDWSRTWWEAEASAQRELTAEAERRFGSADLFAALTSVTKAADALFARAAEAMGRTGAADEALARVAAGAAAQACHQRALALATDAGADHLFLAKFRLFAAGRWPLGVFGDRLYLL